MQLSIYEVISPSNILFNEVQEYNIKDSNESYNRIPIQIKYDKKKKGPLVVETPFLFSFGVSKNLDKNGILIGYTMPVCLWPKDTSPNNNEKDFFNVIKLLEELSKEHLTKKLGEDVTLSSPLYYKKIEYTDKKGKKKIKVDESSSPILYPKFIYSNKSNKILSLFNGKKGNNLDPLKYIDYNCRVKMALIIEGLYVNDNKASLQIKIHECYVKNLEPRKSLIIIEESDDDDDDE